MMDKAIMFTPNDVVAMVLAICGGIITISAAVSVVWKVIEKAKQPEDDQNNRILKLETQVNEINLKFENYDKFLDHDKKRLDNLEFGNEATNEALLALLNHAINGEDKDGLRTAKKKLESYLVSRRAHTGELIL